MAVVGAGQEAKFFEPIPEISVSTRVLTQLAVSEGDQTQVLLAYVKKTMHNPFVSASVCAGTKLGYYHFMVARDEEPPSAEGWIFFIKVDSSKDVGKLNGHMWKLWDEIVDFHRVNKLSVRLYADAINMQGNAREVF